MEGQNVNNGPASAMSGSTAVAPRLRLISYLCPLELYQTYQYYLEEVLNCESYLYLETRWSAPPVVRTDPFTSDNADIAFMSPIGYAVLMDNPNVELLPIAPVYDHPNGGNRPIFYSDIIVRSENREIYKEFVDLRGHRFVLKDEMSLTGNFSMRAELKELGEDLTFFSGITKSGSDYKSIQMVLDGEADAAAIDSNLLMSWLKANEGLADKLHIVCSLGPFPIQPIVVNSRLPDETKKRIAAAFKDIHKHPVHGKNLMKYGVKGFAPVDNESYSVIKDLMESVKGQNMNPMYY
jgi:phosphonate transport system substrate-binding protein